MDNKTFVDTLSKNLDIPQDEVSSMIEDLTSILGESCSEQDNVSIQGFGTFEGRKRMERVAVHPASGKRLLVPPKIVVVFKASPALKQCVSNQEPEDTRDIEAFRDIQDNKDFQIPD